MTDILNRTYNNWIYQPAERLAGYEYSLMQAFLSESTFWAVVVIVVYALFKGAFLVSATLVALKFSGLLGLAVFTIITSWWLGVYCPAWGRVCNQGGL